MAQPTRRKTPERRRATRARSPAATSEVSGLALVASAIGNIVQASKNKNLEQEREQLVAVLQDWQGAFQRLQERERAFRTAYERVATQLENSEQERQRWHMRFLACEKELKARGAASTSGEEGKS